MKHIELLHIKDLGLKYPTKKEIIKGTLLTISVLCIGGTVLYAADAAIAFFFMVA